MNIRDKINFFFKATKYMREAGRLESTRKLVQAELIKISKVKFLLYFSGGRYLPGFS